MDVGQRRAESGCNPRRGRFRDPALGGLGGLQRGQQLRASWLGVCHDDRIVTSQRLRVNCARTCHGHCADQLLRKHPERRAAAGMITAQTSPAAHSRGTRPSPVILTQMSFDSAQAAHAELSETVRRFFWRHAPPVSRSPQRQRSLWMLSTVPSLAWPFTRPVDLARSARSILRYLPACMTSSSVRTPAIVRKKSPTLGLRSRKACTAGPTGSLPAAGAPPGSAL